MTLSLSLTLSRLFLFFLAKKMMSIVALFSICFILLQISLCSHALSNGQPIPITILSGFLGSGKTTLLQHLLQNKDGLKIAVIVNDMASVNVDDKLLMRSGDRDKTGSPDSIIQLSNGCVCCSLSDELLSSISEIVTLSDLRAEDDTFDHIVIELSGVSEPMSVRGSFQDAIYFNMPLMERVCLDTMVTVIDCSTYLKHLHNSATVSPQESPSLFYQSEDGHLFDEKDRQEEMEIYGLNLHDNSQFSAVSDLLVQQTEVADVILLNKVDTVDETVVNRIDQLVKKLNPRAKLLHSQFGRVLLEQTLAVAKGQGVVLSGVVDDHKDAIQAAEKDAVIHNTDLNTSHHSHEHGHQNDQSCSDPDCNDMSHSHSHGHLENNGVCHDADCTDTSHSHSHSHHHDSSKESFSGIGSYVYRARKPFHPGRLAAFLRYLPVSKGHPPVASKVVFDDLESKKSLGHILRSKGFVWLADSHEAAMYWSHAGSSFEMNVRVELFYPLIYRIQ